ncbi:MAG: hypothetical protein JXA10_09175 [Anaerolineae bacterium]|nr:hypothetical protein [Anaerolineae bacterium]
MMNPNATQFEELVAQALQLSLSERLRLIERVAASFNAPAPDPDDPPFTDDEIAELLHVKPLPPTEMAALGLFGGWADMGITDGAEWVNEQKRKRRERRKW